MTIAEEKYVSFTTFTRAGDRKSVPVWIAPVGREIGFTTGADSWKIRRLNNDPRCELQPCDMRGRVVEGAIVVTGKARQATAEEYEQVRGAITGKYGLLAKLMALPSKLKALVGREPGTANAAVLISLD